MLIANNFHFPCKSFNKPIPKSWSEKKICLDYKYEIIKCIDSGNQLERTLWPNLISKKTNNYILVTRWWKNPQISTPVRAFSAIVGVSLKCVLKYHSVSAT
jgi:hypothetical protein